MIGARVRLRPASRCCAVDNVIRPTVRGWIAAALAMVSITAGIAVLAGVVVVRRHSQRHHALVDAECGEQLFDAGPDRVADRPYGFER
jgi:hypothetical protein